MTSNIKPSVWYSGNYSSRQTAKQPPYNGIEIAGLPSYDEDSGLFLSASITFTDYTKDPNGSVVVMPALTFAEGRTTIMAAAGEPTSPPQSPPSSPPQPDSNFTIEGWVALESNGLNYSLRIYLSFGLEHERAAERGYIMSFAKQQTQ